VTLKNYFLVSVGIFVLAMADIHYFPIPVLPFVTILLAGETLLGFQVEHHRVPRLLAELFSVSKHARPQTGSSSGAE
jgi:hypothetical protein